MLFSLASHGIGALATRTAHNIPRLSIKAQKVRILFRQFLLKLTSTLPPDLDRFLCALLSCDRPLLTLWWKSISFFWCCFDNFYFKLNCLINKLTNCKLFIKWIINVLLYNYLIKFGTMEYFPIICKQTMPLAHTHASSCLYNLIACNNYNYKVNWSAIEFSTLLISRSYNSYCSLCIIKFSAKCFYDCII